MEFEKASVRKKTESAEAITNSIIKWEFTINIDIQSQAIYAKRA
jgi:hypothetical protein